MRACVCLCVCVSVSVRDSINSTTNLQRMLSVISQLYNVVFSTTHDNLLNTYYRCQLLLVNSDTAAKTGNNYVSGTESDKVEIPTTNSGFSTTTSSIKV